MGFNNDLYSFYRMVEMADVYGASQLTDVAMENNSEKSNNYEFGVKSFYENLLRLMLDADAKGVYPIDTLINKVKEIVNNGNKNMSDSDINDDVVKTILHAIRLYSTDDTIKFQISGKDMLYQNGYADDNGEIKSATLKQILNWDDEDKLNKKKIGVVLATTPMLTPQMKNTNKIQFWLNSIPSYVASRITPYFDVKFQFQREHGADDEHKNTSFGLLKFLEGANLTMQNNTANKAMYDGNWYKGDAISASSENKPTHNNHYRAGMEVFLSPQTLVNPNAEGDSDRYVDVIDRFRPLASLKSAEINIQPLIGFMTYKHGSLTFTLHDRSRLHEISDMIRPQLFKGTTLWLTYGWRHPEEQNNAYAEFINNNLLMREAFMVVNSEFSFDNAGQVEVKLKIATQGAQVAQLSSILGKGNNVESLLEELETIRKKVVYLKNRLNLTPPQGIKDEVRAYELLDFASRGAMPDMDQNDLKKAILKLKAMLNSNTGSSELDELIGDVRDGIEKLYSSSNSKEGKFFELLKGTYEEVIRKKFQAVSTTPDPWLPSTDEKILSEVPDYVNPKEIVKEFEFANDVKNMSDGNVKFNKRVVSFGKLFSMFVGDAISTLDDTDEVQLWFYKLNDSCGPASGINIASFPIELSTFLRKYNDYVFNKRSQSISVKEFISLVISTQFNDVRALAYGMRKFYEPFDPKNEEPAVQKGQQKALEDAVKERQRGYGVFVKPVIQVFIETMHARVDNTSSNGVDLLQLLEYIDAPDANKFGASPNAAAGSYKRVMRIHVYDKTVNPYPVERNMLQDKTGHIVELPPTSAGKAIHDKLIDIQRSFGTGNSISQEKIRNLIDYKTNSSGESTQIRYKTHDIQPRTGGVNAKQMLSDEISRRVPTITYGSNGSTVTSAGLSTQADPRVSTINMIRPKGNPNTLQPNGSSSGGLPVRVIPATMNMSSLGCPLVAPAQLFYVDFKTGTTIDNLYILTNVTHTFGPGKFETGWQFGYSDGYARYESLPTVMMNFVETFKDELK